MKIHNSNFETSVNSISQLPQTGLPEIAFVGRSNVGKSSIINALLNRKSLAKVGAVPGKTRMINFFNIDNKLYFVDLPGYGYASVSKDSKSNWAKVIEGYLNTRETLKLIVMLVDIRHEPTQDDKMMYNWIKDYKLASVVAASKSDKITRSQISNKLNEIKKALNIPENTGVIPFSCQNKSGIAELWSILDSYLVLD